jgi:hypothetical protein
MYGYLSKIANQSKSIDDIEPQDWKETFFTIQDGRLRYYKTHSSQYPQSVIDLSICSVSEVPELISHGFVFEVCSGTEYLLIRASTRIEMTKWVTLLERFTTRTNFDDEQFNKIQEAINNVERSKKNLFEKHYKPCASFRQLLSDEVLLSRFSAFLVRRMDFLYLLNFISSVKHQVKIC